MMEWISIEDKLPEEGQCVIYYFEHTGIACGRYNDVSKEDDGIHGKNLFSSKCGFLTDDVTHWMPLPEPPPHHEKGDAGE